MSLTVALALTATAARGQSFVVSEPAVPVFGYGTVAYGVSADGSVVVGHFEGQPYRWTSEDGLLPLGPTTGWALAYAASSDGSVIVGSDHQAAFRWTDGSGMSGLGTPPGGGPSSFARGVSADGTVVVGDGSGPTTRGFRWTPDAGMEQVGAFNVLLFDVSASGDVMVGANSGQAFRWTGLQEGHSVSPPLFTGQASLATAISSDESTIVGYTSCHTSACRSADVENYWFMWTADRGAQVFDAWPFFSFARDISADGKVVVGQDNRGPGLVDRSFVWDRANGMQALSNVLSAAGADMTGWYPQDATAVSDDGKTIVGVARGEDLNDYSFIATLDCPNDDDCDTVLDAEDNCPGLRTANIEDANSNGIGDMCECGDQTGDGHTNVADILAIMNVIFEQEEASPLCDTNDDNECNVADVLGVNAKIFGAPAYCARYPAP